MRSRSVCPERTSDGWRRYAARLREAQRQRALERLAAALERTNRLLELVLRDSRPEAAR